jgi:hypothetical protein
MKTATRPQYHRLRRILEMVREGTRTGLECQVRESSGTASRHLAVWREHQSIGVPDKPRPSPDELFLDARGKTGDLQR